jgi:hypothetical protein
VTKYTYALDEQLKMINREEFFKQFLNPSLLSLRADEFIDIYKNDLLFFKYFFDSNKKNIEKIINFVYPEKS